MADEGLVMAEDQGMPSSQMSEDRFGPTASASPTPAVDPSMAFLSPVAALAPAGTPLEDKVLVEKELDLIAAAMRVFHMKPADLVMRECSAYTARLTELTVQLHRIEGTHRQWARIRTQQVAKFLEEADRQWKTASRLIEVQRQDLQVLGGQS